MANKTEVLTFDHFYHIYNRAVGDDLLFRETKNYRFFVRQVRRYLFPVIDIYAYCFMPNHFHFLAKVKDKNSIIKALQINNKRKAEKFINQSFSNLFNSYTKAYNKIYERRGKLFLLPYKRILIQDEDYLRVIIKYIHRNPIHHGFVKKYDTWKYSSYKAYIIGNSSFVEIKKGMNLFGSQETFVRDHEEFNRQPPDLTGFLKPVRSGKE